MIANGIDTGTLRIANPSAPGSSFVECPKLSLRLFERACAKAHVTAGNPACVDCSYGHERAVKLGVKKELKPAQDDQWVRTARCKKCRSPFVSRDGREHYCQEHATPKSRLKHAVEKACALLRACGYMVDVHHCPNGAVLLFCGPDADAEAAIAVLAAAGYGVRIDSVSVGSAIFARDLLARRNIPDVRIRLGEKRSRRRPLRAVRPEPSYDAHEQLGLFATGTGSL